MSTTTENSEVAELDPSTLDALAELICGDDGPRYRKGRELPGFLRRAGISGIPDYDGSYRYEWTREEIEGGDGELTNAERAALRLADPREYSGERSAYLETMRRLGDILRLDGVQIVQDSRGLPKIAELSEPAESGVDARIRGVKLKVSLGQVITDDALAAVAEHRLNEARLCHDAGAFMASVIMLGSLLEGILVFVAGERLQGNRPRQLDRMGLEELINLAHQEGWIQVDVQMGSELIRRYRNLVHPRAQLRMGDPPDADTLDICWPVVNATLNDLARP